MPHERGCPLLRGLSPDTRVRRRMRGAVATGTMAWVKARDVVVLGSTGSIGTQALDIIRRNPDRFRVVALAAGGSDPDALARQAAQVGVAAVAVANPAAAPQLQAALRHHFEVGRTDSGTAPAHRPLSGGPPLSPLSPLA